ncbi:hypothetical protein CK203_090612 [Vitis vinifera]|uniref:Uncharacterized protein n=1 Tax=Vitis vinifera TaxID=29760 RepID=A0A438DVS5_VITVI|nr:hypothetical protein CK203_090612 [Vitis vinifera]
MSDPLSRWIMYFTQINVPLPGHFQSGTSVEEIKKYAARERNKELAQLSKVDVQGNDALTSSAVSAAL